MLHGYDVSRSQSTATTLYCRDKYAGKLSAN